MTFQCEAEMQAPVRKWLDDQGLATKTEFTTPWGICDLVGVAFNPPSVAKRLSLGQMRPIGSPLRVALLQEIPDKETGAAVTFPRLARLFESFLEPQRIRQELESLEEGKFIVSPRRNSYQRINGWLPLHRQIVAVELKLSRMPDAVAQAAAHLAFATESYVALPAPLAQAVVRDRRRSLIASHGIGLLAVERDACHTLVAPPRGRSSADPVLQLAFVDRFWRFRDSSS